MNLTLSCVLLEGRGRKCSNGSIANTPTTEITIQMASLSCVQIYKKICAGRHIIDKTSANNPRK
jgi:hypothetical protein